MASAKVREAMESFLKKPEYQLDTLRNARTRCTAEKLVEAIQQEPNVGAFNVFADRLLAAVQSVFSQSSAEGVTTDALKEKALTRFHVLRLGKLEGLWNELFTSLAGSQIPRDAMLEQCTNQQIFDSACVAQLRPTQALPRRCDISLTTVEENILRYVAGYIPFKLQQRFEKETSLRAAQYVECLSHLSVKGEGEDLPTYATKWIEQVNRGGLFMVNDTAYVLFRLLELLVRGELECGMPTSSASGKQLKERVMRKIAEDCDIQFQWTLLAIDIEDDGDSQELLRIITELWLTIRIHALTSGWMERYKQAKKKRTSKEKALRKTLQMKDNPKQSE